jgi:hypothetical protein
MNYVTDLAAAEPGPCRALLDDLRRLAAAHDGEAALREEWARACGAFGAAFGRAGQAAVQAGRAEEATARFATGLGIVAPAAAEEASLLPLCRALLADFLPRATAASPDADLAARITSAMSLGAAVSASLEAGVALLLALLRAAPEAQEPAFQALLAHLQAHAEEPGCRPLLAILAVMTTPPDQQG